MHGKRLLNRVRNQATLIQSFTPAKPVFTEISLWHIFINHSGKQFNMKKKSSAVTGTKKGYNEKNPGEQEGAFRPASHSQVRKDEPGKSNAVDKKRKEENS
jgi:hypothetical protein